MPSRKSRAAALSWTLALACITALCAQCSAETVPETWLDILHHSGAYSSYHRLPEDMQRQPDGSEEFLEQCSLVQIQYMGRHGSRYPFDHMVTKYEARGKKLRDLASLDGTRLPPWIAKWSFQPFLGHGSAGDLHEGGERELYNIARRLKQEHSQLQELFHFADKVGVRGALPVGSFGSNRFRFRSSQYLHTIRSADTLAFAFLEGEGGIGSCQMEGGKAGSYQPVYVDSSEMTSRRLTAYSELKDQCKTASVLQHAREDGIAAKQRLLGPIAERLTAEWNIRTVYNVTATEVNHYFSLCAFEMELAGISDQFCSLFSAEDRQKWELYVDSSSYNEFGYDFLPYAETGAVVMKDIYAAMSALVKGKEYAPSSVVHVGHRQTLLTLAATLGLYKEPLGVTPDFYSEDRKWRTSDIAPFAGHFLFLLYDCSGSPRIREGNEEVYFVRVQHNERDADLPLARTSVAIPYSLFWSSYGDVLDDSLDAICLRHTGEHVQSSTPRIATKPMACPEHTYEPPQLRQEDDVYLLEQCGSFPLAVFAAGLLAGCVCMAGLQQLGGAAFILRSGRRRVLL